MKNRALCLERLGRPEAALDVLEALPARFPNLTDAERQDYEQKLAELGKRSWLRRGARRSGLARRR